MAEQFSEQAAVDLNAPALTARATLAATIGNMLEFYDFIVYSFFALQRLRHYLCRCYRMLRRHRAIDRHLADSRDQQCASASLVHAVCDGGRPRRHGDDARNRAGDRASRNTRAQE